MEDNLLYEHCIFCEDKHKRDSPQLYHLLGRPICYICFHELKGVFDFILNNTSDRQFLKEE